MSEQRLFGPHGIRINAVAPGIIRTQLWERMEPDHGRYKDMVAARIPLRADQTPEEIADAVAFLCSVRRPRVGSVGPGSHKTRSGPDASLSVWSS